MKILWVKDETKAIGKTCKHCQYHCLCDFECENDEHIQHCKKYVQFLPAELFETDDKAAIK